MWAKAKAKAKAKVGCFGQKAGRNRCVRVPVPVRVAVCVYLYLNIRLWCARCELRVSINSAETELKTLKCAKWYISRVPLVTHLRASSRAFMLSSSGAAEAEQICCARIQIQIHIQKQLQLQLQMRIRIGARIQARAQIQIQHACCMPAKCWDTKSSADKGGIRIGVRIEGDELVNGSGITWPARKSRQQIAPARKRICVSAGAAFMLRNIPLKTTVACGTLPHWY